MTIKLNSLKYLDNYFNTLTKHIKKNQSNDKIVKLSKLISNIKKKIKKFLYLVTEAVQL